MEEEQADRIIELLGKIDQRLNEMADTRWGETVTERIEDRLERIDDKFDRMLDRLEQIRDKLD